MCYHEVMHIHCETCNKDLYPGIPIAKSVFCQPAKRANRRFVGDCPFYCGTRHVHEKAPEDDCVTCVSKRLELL